MNKKLLRYGLWIIECFNGDYHISGVLSGVLWLVGTKAECEAWAESTKGYEVRAYETQNRWTGNIPCPAL